MGRRGRKKKRDLKNKHRAHFSFPFYFALPCNFVLAIFVLIAFMALLDNYIIEEEIWSSFGLGAIAVLFIAGTSKMSKTRVFIHELKHFIVVILTGNRVKDFHVDTHTGHVAFAMYTDKVHFAPFIAMAPYFWPLLSLPMLIACLIFEDYNKAMLSIALGATLSFDLVTAYQDIHPHQTDFKQVFGGFLVCGVYLAGFHFMWTMFCLLWVLAGRSGFVYAFYVFYELGQVAVAHLS
jgi:hypothetical protein